MATAVIDAAGLNYNILDGLPHATCAGLTEDQSIPRLLDQANSDADVPPIILLHFWRGDFEQFFVP